MAIAICGGIQTGNGNICCVALLITAYGQLPCLFSEAFKSWQDCQSYYNVDSVLRKRYDDSFQISC